MITAWASVCTLDNCTSAARVTGTYPVSMEVVLGNAYVRELEGVLPELYSRRRANLEVHWTIGNKVLTDPENFLMVVEIVRESETQSYLREATYPSYVCRDNYEYYARNARDIANWRKNGCCLFSRPPPYYCVGKAPVMFDV